MAICGSGVPLSSRRAIFNVRDASGLYFLAKHPKGNKARPHQGKGQLLLDASAPRC
jgi:hypothetical protein